VIKAEVKRQLLTCEQRLSPRSLHAAGEQIARLLFAAWATTCPSLSPRFP